MHAHKTHKHLNALVSTIPPLFCISLFPFYPPLSPYSLTDWLDLMGGGMDKAEEGGGAVGLLPTTYSKHTKDTNDTPFVKC